MNKSILFKLKAKIEEGNSRSIAVKKNIIGSFAIKGISILISLMLVPMTLGYVSSEMYGIWLTLSSVMLWLNFFDVGFTLGLKNKLAIALARKDYIGGKKLVSTTYAMMILIFIPLMVILEIIVPHVNWSELLNVNVKYEYEIQKCIHVLLCFICLQMIVNIITSVIAAYQKVALSSLFPVIGNAISLILIYILTKTVPPSLTILAFAISSLPVIVMFASSIILFKNKFKQISPSISHIDRSSVKSLFNLGFKFFIIQIQIVVFFQMTNILISNIAGPVVVSEYNIAYKYLNIAEMGMTLLVAPLWPAFTDAFTQKDYKWMNNTYKKMLKVALLVIVLLVFMTCLSPFVYKIWIGNKLEVSFSMTITIAINLILQTLNVLNVNIINGIGTVKLQTFLVCIGMIFHIPLSLFLGEHFGGIGVVLSMIIIRLIYLPTYFLQVHKLLNQKAHGIWNS